MRTICQRADPASAAERRGLAMVAVLLVLMALFVLSAPYLLTVRNADQASSESSDRSTLRVTLDSAQRHALGTLGASHPGLDRTPYFDDIGELTVTSRFAEGFLDTRDPAQVMWEVEAEDVAGRVDLSSASPQVLANLFGGAARLTAEARDKDTELSVSSTEGFLPEGVVYVDNELIHYAELGPTTLGRLQRGLLVKSGSDGSPAGCGPTPPSAHAVGAFVLDQRAFGLCEWRIATGKLRAYDGLEQLREARDFLMAGELGREAYLALERTASTFGHVRTGQRWQRPARLTGDVAGEPENGCSLPVDELRWFNPGTTVRISDGRNTDYGMVRSAEGALVLTEPLRNRYERHETLVWPLARAPVNVNSARPEVLKALWTNLKLRGKSARITAGEAEKLVDLVLVSRPFTGFEDFLRRCVLPAGGLDELPKDAPVRPEALEELAREARLDGDGQPVLQGFIDADDALALYKNALNANDNELEFATMPLAFTSRDVYEFSLRAVVNAPSKIERASGVRELCELVVPQQDLLAAWTRQEDFDMAPRLDREAAGWLTGPVPTSRYDPLYGEVASLRWPSRARAHLGPHDSAPSVDPLADTQKVYCFAAREDESGWVQLAPSREEDAARRASYALHFDDESKTLEGRFLPDGTFPLDLAKLGWAGAGGLMSGMSYSMWIQPRELEDGARLLDVGGAFKDSDRLSLLFEQNDLVLRLLDGAGDHPLSSFVEQSELRFTLSGEGPGMPLDTWSHVEIAVDGSRPDQMALWVDGRRSTRTPGLTRLTGGITGESDTLAVESTEGFPERCVLRVGNELIEAIKKGPKSFQAKFESQGENAGFGGRSAREQFRGVEGSEINQGLYKNTDHPSGSTVELYGYSLPFFNNVSSAGSGLSSALGAFAVARVEGIVRGGSEQTQNKMEIIESTLSSGNPLVLGWGLDSQKDDVEALMLQPADPNGDASTFMQAFDPKGGYAALLGVRFELTVDEGIGGTTQVTNDKYGVRLGGVEVIRYSGWDGTQLRIESRGDQINLPKLSAPGVNPDVAGRGSYIFWFNEPFVDDTEWSDQNLQLAPQVMVIPISIGAGSSGGIAGFPVPVPGVSEFVQITRTGSDAHLTEWVRYDDVTTDGQLVRDDPLVLLEANEAAHAGTLLIVDDGDKKPPGPSGGGGPGTIGGGGNKFEQRMPAVLGSEPGSARVLRPPRTRQAGQSIWYYGMGETEDDDLYVTRAVRTHLQFRGVFGTYSHPQPQGASVLPAFKTFDISETTGWPGRFDHVAMRSDDPTEPGFPGVVQRAHRPSSYTRYTWIDPVSGTPEANEGRVIETPQSGLDLGAAYVALQEPVPIFIPATAIGNQASPIDSRRIARMTLFPSGELPRNVSAGQLGGDVFGGGSVPAAVVDEALFFPNSFPNIAGMPGQLVLAEALGEGDNTFTAVKDTVRTTLGDLVTKTQVLSALPQHGGLLRMGDELLCYDSYDADTFTFTLPSGARGLLGTTAQPHRAGEAISYLSSRPLGVLSASIGADDAAIPLLELPPGFPSQGTVWIEGELVHYTRTEGGVLHMPRASSEPGEMDEKGAGLFRGRFGTQRAGHAAGTPAVLFPFRYWDRWTELADAPELTYMQLSCDQPDAFWKRVFWKVGEPAFPGPELGVLQRTDPEKPWDGVPDEKSGLNLLWKGKLDGDGNPIGVQSDRLDWRVFVRHLPGSFDPDQGLAHGWKTSPRLELFGVEYMGPGRTLARADR